MTYDFSFLEVLLHSCNLSIKWVSADVMVSASTVPSIQYRRGWWSVPLMYSHPSSPPSATRHYNPAVSPNKLEWLLVWRNRHWTQTTSTLSVPFRTSLFYQKWLNALSWSSSSITEIRMSFSQSDSQLTDDLIPPSQQCWSYTTTWYVLLVKVIEDHFTSLH